MRSGLCALGLSCYLSFPALLNTPARAAQGLGWSAPRLEAESPPALAPRRLLSSRAAPSASSHGPGLA